MITIILPKKEKNDDFSMSDLFAESIIYHNDCNGGEITLKYSQKEVGQIIYDVSCKRCLYVDTLYLHDFERADICKTAIDGEERKLGKAIIRQKK